jgi:small-conductance mechanosensitive channel
MMRAMSLIIRSVFFLALVLGAWPAAAQAPDPAKFFDDARAQIVDIRKQLGSGDVKDAKLGEFRDAAGQLAAQADALAADRAPKLAAIQARQAELGPAPPKGTSEAPDIAAQRADLEKQRAALDAEIKRAKLLSVDSQQLGAEIAEARRANFQASLSQRTASPLTPTFWSDVGASMARDAPRLGALRDGMRAALGDAFAEDNRVAAFAGLAIGLLLIVVGRWWAERALMRVTTDRVPQGRLRRSALALAVVVVATVFAGFGAEAIVIGLGWRGAFSDAESGFAQAIVGSVFFGSFVAGLGRALLSAGRPSWRLPPIPDAVAQRLRPFPLLFGVAVGASTLLNYLNALVSLSATIAGSFVVSVVYAVLIAWALKRAAVQQTPEEEDAQPRPAWMGLAIAVAWLGVFATLIAAMLGYIAFAHQMARQMVWLGIVASMFYLLVHLVEDLFATALSSRALWAQRTLGLEARTLDQVAVLLSGAFRVAVFLFALMLAFMPFVTEPGDLVTRSGRLGAGLKVGQIEVTPSAVLGAVFVFLIGLAAVRTLKRWLGERYLPTTRLDPGMRSSVTTLLGYAGIVVVVAFALSELGLSVERIAWVASALSVGIGFGLQAIVQNFVSGLILLAERPVKVGDWVVLGDTEGDIRRINVRATEIQLGDRSTVIVPNSELITKSVRNVTLTNAEGRVRIRLPVPLQSDAERVRQLVMAAFAAHPGVLQTPASSVLLDGIDGGSLVFIAVAYIANPRQASAVRSDLLFDILKRLRAEGIALATPYDVQLLTPLPAGSH